MISLKTLKPQIYYKLLKHQNPLLITQTFFKLHEFVFGVESNSVLPTQRRMFSSKEQFETDLKKRGMKKMKSLDVVFNEAVGLSEKVEGESGDSEEEEEEENGGEGLRKKLKEVYELKKKLRKIEKEVRIMKGNLKNTVIKKVGESDGNMKEKEKEKEKKKNTLKKKVVESNGNVKEKSVAGLYSLFTSIPKNPHLLLAKNDDCEKKLDVSDEESLKLRPMKEFSPEVIALVKLLHEKGYLSDANFLPRTKELDLDCFSTLYSRGFVKARAERLAKDHPEISK